VGRGWQIREARDIPYRCDNTQRGFAGNKRLNRATNSGAATGYLANIVRATFSHLPSRKEVA
jgi:hypothetical protein